MYKLFVSLKTTMRFSLVKTPPITRMKSVKRQMSPRRVLYFTDLVVTHSCVQANLCWAQHPKVSGTWEREDLPIIPPPCLLTTLMILINLTVKCQHKYQLSFLRLSPLKWKFSCSVYEYSCISERKISLCSDFMLNVLKILHVFLYLYVRKVAFPAITCVVTKILGGKT